MNFTKEELSLIDKITFGITIHIMPSALEISLDTEDYEAAQSIRDKLGLNDKTFMF